MAQLLCPSALLLPRIKRWIVESFKALLARLQSKDRIGGNMGSAVRLGSVDNVAVSAY